MPARREYTAAELAERLSARRRQAREGMARLREARKAVNATPAPVNPTVNATAPESGAVKLTPPTPARLPNTPQRTTPLPPKGGSPQPAPAALAVPKPNKSGAVIDLLRARGLCDVLEDADHKAIKATPLTPKQIVDAVQAVASGAWDNEWLRQNLTVQGVIRRYQGFAATQAGRGRRRPTRGESASARAERMFEEVLNGSA